jgi:hypothetical protein
MTVKANLDLFQQMAFLTSVLSGFAFSGVTQLICLEDKRKVVSWTVGALAASAIILLASTFAWSTSIIVIGSFESVRNTFTIEAAQRLSRAVTIGKASFWLGLNLFLVGAGLVGWVRSKNLGTLTTAAAVVAGLFSLWFARFVSQPLP